MDQKIFTFGGADESREKMTSSEVYDVVLNLWKKLLDMPTPGALITCVGAANHILISSREFRLLSYDIHNEAYSYVGEQSFRKTFRCIASSKEKLYLFEDNKISVMSKQCEVLDTITVRGIDFC